MPRELRKTFSKAGIGVGRRMLITKMMIVRKEMHNILDFFSVFSMIPSFLKIF